MESIDNALQGILIAIDIITVKLYGKTATSGIIHSKFPASSNTQVCTDRLYMDDPVITERINDFTGSVGGMVINHKNIESKIRFLPEYRGNCIPYCGFAVKNRYYYRSLYRKIPDGEVYFFIFTRWQPGFDLFEVMCTDLFHLHLHLTLRRIYIIELFFTTLAHIVLVYCIDIVAMVIDLTDTFHSQTQLIQACISIIAKLHLEITFQCLDPEKHERTEIKIVPQASRLQVYGRSISRLSIDNLAVVRIGHHRLFRHCKTHLIQFHFINTYSIFTDKKEEVTFCRSRSILNPGGRLQQAVCHNRIYIIFCHFKFFSAKIIKRWDIHYKKIIKYYLILKRVQQCRKITFFALSSHGIAALCPAITAKRDINGKQQKKVGRNDT